MITNVEVFENWFGLVLGGGGVHIAKICYNIGTH
jgi:hypothetical protein